jgi:hypothetical protein
MTSVPKAKFYTLHEGGEWHRFDGNRPHRVVAAIVFEDGWVFDAVLGDWREQFTLKQLDQISISLSQAALKQ